MTSIVDLSAPRWLYDRRRIVFYDDGWTGDRLAAG
jgi:hypothetical protein